MNDGRRLAIIRGKLFFETLKSREKSQSAQQYNYILRRILLAAIIWYINSRLLSLPHGMFLISNFLEKKQTFF